MRPFLIARTYQGMIDEKIYIAEKAIRIVAINDFFFLSFSTCHIQVLP